MGGPPGLGFAFGMLGRLGTDARHFAGLEMAPAHAAVLHLEVDEVGIAWIATADVAVAAKNGEPVLVDRPDASLEADGRAAPGAVVLQAAEGPVRAFVVHRDVVELAERKVVEMV